MADQVTETVTAAQSAQVVEPPAPAPAAEPHAEAPETVEALPPWAQKLVRDLRTEAASNRTKANEVTTQSQATMDAIAKALGLKQDDDPAVAAKTAADERDAERQRAAGLTRELTIVRSALKAGADPEALTDSRSFMAKFDALDPATDDFTAKVDEAVKAAVEANPSLVRGTAAPAVRSGGPVGGGANIPGQLSREDLKDMTPDEINKARVEGRLDTLLGVTK